MGHISMRILIQKTPENFFNEGWIALVLVVSIK